MKKLYELTYSQKNILNITNLYPNSAINCISGTFKIVENGNVEVLKKAINLYIENNDGMRIKLTREGAEVYQYIDDYNKVEFEEIDFDNERELYLWEEIESKSTIPIFDNTLFYFKIVKIKNGDIGYFVKCSHIISDAWTFTRFVSGILNYYYAIIDGKDDSIKKQESFADHIMSENEYMKSNRFERDKEYWEKELEDIDVKTILKHNNKGSIDAKRTSIVLPSKLNEKINEYCKLNKTSPFNLFVSALSMYIKRATNKENVIIGTTTLNRTNAKEKEMFGMFVNTCPIKIKLSDNMNFEELVKSVNSNSMSLLRHQKYPYELLLDELREKYDFKDNLFEIVLNYQNAKFDNEDGRISYTTRWHFNGAQIESLIININDREDSGQLIVSYDYLKDCFTFKEIEYLHKHMIGLLWHALDDDNKPIKYIEMLPEEEQDRILSRFNNVEISEELDDIQVEKRESRNVKAYILDKNNVALPIGIAGDLYVGRKIDEEYIENPYEKGEKIYKTGKIARWYPKGDIEILKVDDERLLIPKFNLRRPKANVNIVFSGSFVTEPVRPYIKHFSKMFNYKMNIDFSDYNQVLQELINDESKINSNKDGINVILVRLEDYIRDNNGSLSQKKAIIDDVANQLVDLLSKVNNTTLLGVFKKSNVITDKSILKVIEENSAKILDSVKSNKNIFILNIAEVVSNYCIDNVFDSDNDKIAHIPYTKEFYAGLSAEIFRKIVAFKRKPYKVIVLDCDNTLWGGVCGEVGTNGIDISSEYKALQEFVLSKQKEGFLLAINSKNNLEDVLDVFENNHNMILKKDDIANWKVNWENKATNIQAMAKELNLGLDSFIFLDDNPMECINMMGIVPEVLTINVPSKEAIPMFLKHLWFTDNLVVTDEDRERSKRYLEEQQRKSAEKEVNSIEDFIKKLDIKVSMREISSNEIQRASQMTMRTNQFNLSTIRRNEKEIEALAVSDDYKVFIIEANDKFGEYGIVGLLILKIDENVIVDTFLLSCRILGRNVENVVLVGIKKLLQSLNKDKVIFEYVKSEKNQPILNFLEKEPFLRATNSNENASFELLVDNICEVNNIELLYNKKFDKVTETCTNNINDIRENVTESETINYDSSISLVNNKLIKSATDKEYLLVLKEYTGKKIIDSIENRIIKGEYRKPTTDTEVRLCQIWCEALKLKQVGISNDFFDIGGDSLSAVFVLSQILKEFNVTLGLTDLFKYKTIREVAEIIDKKKVETYIPIPQVDKKEFYELSSAQTRMFLINQIEGANVKYNETQMLKVYGPLDIEKLELAFNKIIERHEILRTAFFMKDGKPVQKVFDDAKLKIECVNAKEDDVEELRKCFVRTFDLENPPLFRVLIARIDVDKYIMLFDIHHIVIDGTSFGILINEVLSVYDGKELCKVVKQYKDFAAWQNSNFESEKIKLKEEYWIEQFSNEIPVLNLPYDFSRPPVLSGSGKKVYFTIDEKITKKLKSICYETETTLFMFLFAVYNVLMYRYSNQEDIVIGIPVAAREHPDTENMLGMFINNLAIRSKIDGKMSFLTYLMQVKENVIKALDNQEYPYEKLVNKLNIQRDMSRNPLFDVMFSLQNMDLPDIKTENLKFERCNFDNGTAKQDLSLFIEENEKKLEIMLEYSTELFKQDTIERFLQHYENCIELVLNDLSLQLGELDFLTSYEKIAYNKFNNTKYDYNEELTVNSAFEIQTEKYPNKVAIIFNDESISYSELNERANNVAQILRENGVKSNSSVGVMIERSTNLIVGLLGVLKAGGYYVPIDPEYPQDRIEYMLNNSNANVLLTQESLSNKVIFEGKKILIENCDGKKSNNLLPINTNDDLMYTIYTSGSTGNPKGVMLTHKNIVNFMLGVANKIKFSESEIILGITTVSFDIFVLETWFALCYGIKIVLASAKTQFNVNEIVKLIKNEKITTIQMTPSRLKPVMQCGKNEDFINVKNILIGGEPLTSEMLALIKSKSSANIYNMYGPTETAVWSSIANMTSTDEITIGEPITNTTFYVLNEFGLLQPFGVAGELCIGGHGLAKGYKGREDLTQERFYENQFINDKVYKTGDRVKMTDTLELRFIGRMDNQIKFRGYRIEVQDIEKNVASYAGISQCVVVLSSNSEQLCAYYTTNSDVEEKELREYLFAKIPSYMIPTYFKKVEEFPYTPNGKVDRKVLKLMSDNILNNVMNSDDAVGDIQCNLCRCFEKALEVEHINQDANFFELGGDSLKVIKLTMEIYNEFGVELDYKDVFLTPTISELSKKISSMLINNYSDNIDLGANYSLLNKKCNKNIFAFPPITGYGLAFNDISSFINEFSLYAFNYIEDDDKITKYIEEMKSVQAEGPYLLLGFSAGADIVIDIASRLGDDAKVVLMDGFFGKISKDEIDEKLKFFVKYSMDYAKIESENSFLSNILERKIRNYMCYMADKEKFSKPITTDIYFIQSQEMQDSEVEEIAKLTTGKIIKFKARGNHFDLLKKEFACDNAKIIEEIFSSMEE